MSGVEHTMIKIGDVTQNKSIAQYIKLKQVEWDFVNDSYVLLILYCTDREKGVE